MSDVPRTQLLAFWAVLLQDVVPRLLFGETDMCRQAGLAWSCRPGLWAEARGAPAPASRGARIRHARRGAAAVRAKLSFGGMAVALRGVRSFSLDRIGEK